MGKRLSFLIEEDLPDSKSNFAKEKVVTLTQGRFSSLIDYPLKNNPNNNYVLHNVSDLDVVYGVRVLWKENSKQQQLDFDMDISILNSDDTYSYQLNRNQVYLNNSLPDTTIEELANTCGNVLYPTLIDFQDYSITNSSEIKNRWIKLKKDIKGKFQGDYVNNYLNAMDEILNSELSINLALKQDIFLSLWRHIVETRVYDEQLKSKVIFNFPMIPFSNPIRYKGTQYLEKYYTKYNTIKTRLSGTIADNRSVKDLKERKKFPTEKNNSERLIPEGDCNLEYDLDRKTGILKFCTAEINLKLGEEIKSFKVIINQLMK